MKYSLMESAVEQEIRQQTDCLHDMALVKFPANICMITAMTTAYLTLWNIQETASDQKYNLSDTNMHLNDALTSVKLFCILHHTSRVLLLSSKQSKETNWNLHMINPPKLSFIIPHITLFFQYRDEKSIVYKMGFSAVSHVGHCRKKSSGNMTNILRDCHNHNKYWLCYHF